MAFFPRSLVNVNSQDAGSFHPLFRFLDDFDHYSRNTKPTEPLLRNRDIMKSFTPKFDVKEVEGSYELHGELPGVEQKDVDIEFTDAYTITVKGRTQRSYTAGTPPAGQLEGEAPKATITESGETNNHHATVEDESTPVATPNTATSELAKQTSEGEQPQEPKVKYWVSERSVGEFSRTFTFPIRVDTEGVTASMKNGILTISIPKAKKADARKIAIN